MIEFVFLLRRRLLNSDHRYQLLGHCDLGLVIVALYKIEYLLLHVIVSVHDLDTIDPEFAAGYRLKQLLVRVVLCLHLELLVDYQGLQDAY